ncbi:TonB-dependent receptor domain-containing protein [Aromatoleum evansii]|uniref:TonB-dependent receptor domain-containing protein n=1 Tax=Aromatoleum evansii TaxID=59406 RepID=UPI00145E2D6E|nr:TonB-dependent receptor [Aromatoleum evansii]NMG30111.1 TonB-dependent receptor [Aromatoleum evansii]
MNIRLSATAVAVAAALPFASAAVAAEEKTGETVVVTATRQPQRASEVLASVDVIERDEIEQSGQSSLLELLGNRAGVQISSNGGPGKTSSLFMRGTNSNHTVLFVDGVRLGSATTGQAPFQNISLDQIERVEILRGPASALYGADAVGGVVQVFTKKGEGGFRPELFVGAGTYETTDVSAGVSGAAGAWSYAFRAGQYETDGVSAKKGPFAARQFFHDYDPALDADRDGFRATTASGSLGFKFNNDHDLELNVLHAQTRNWYDGNGFNSRGGADVGNDDVAESIGLASRNRLTSNWTSTVRIAQSKDESSGFRDSFQFDTLQSQAVWQNDVKLPLGSALLAYEYLDQRVDSTTAFAKKGRWIESLLAGWSATLGRHQWQLNVRQDQNSQFGDETTYLASYGYKLTPLWSVSGALGTAFKAPTLNDLYYVDSFGNHGDPSLKPERSRNREAALKYDDGSHSASVTYFNNRISNLIEWNAAPPTFAFVPEQTDDARIEGWEFAYAAKLYGFDVSTSIDLMDAKNLETGKRLHRRAREQGRLAISREVGPFRFGGELIGVGKRFDRAGEVNELSGYSLLNLFARYAVNRDWAIEARANNVLDRDYELAKGFNTLGATVFVGVRYAPK